MGTSTLQGEQLLRRQITLIMLIRALAMSMGFAIPIFVDVWERRFNLTMSEILLLEALFQGVWLLFDIPLGYLADVWGRRRALILGACLLAGGAAIYIFTRSLFGIIVAEIVIAIGMASVSGSDQAILRYSLRLHDREEEFDRYWGYAQAADVSYLTVTAVVGGLLYTVSPVLPFVAASAGFLTLALIAALLREEPRVSRTAGVRHLYEIIRIARTSLRNPRLLWVFTMNGFVFALLQVTMWLTAKYLAAAGMPIGVNGWIFAGLGVLGAIFISRIAGGPNGVDRRMFASRNTAILVICFFGLSLQAHWAGLLLLGLLQWTRAEFRVRPPGWIRLEVHHDEHATGSSISGAMFRVIFIVLSVVIHFLARDWTVEQMFALLGVISLVGGGLLCWFCPAIEEHANLGRIEEKEERPSG